MSEEMIKIGEERLAKSRRISASLEQTTEMLLKETEERLKKVRR